jgi:hypothetical protein
VRRHRLRTDIYQASWNYRYRDAFPTAVILIAIALGLITLSWWVGLAVCLGLFILPHNKAVGVFSWGISLIVAGLVGTSVYGAFESTGAVVVLTLIAFSYVFVPLRSSEQYWRDLEKDGGPWSD